ncbi:MAG: hypothetical protein ACYC0V_13220 [Armatimonadota bacterium]
MNDTMGLAAGITLAVILRVWIHRLAPSQMDIIQSSSRPDWDAF